MQGSVYNILLTNLDDGKPHPHVVVLTFTGNRDCIVVPAYSTDGYAIQCHIDANRKSGLRDDQIFVTLDNSVDVDFTSPFPAKEAIWCVTRLRRILQHEVLRGKRLGQMKPPALLKIAKCLLQWAETDDSDLSPAATKILKNLIKNLSAAPEHLDSPDPSI